MIPLVLLSTALLALPPDMVDPSLFPGVSNRTDEVTLAGLSLLYPGHVLHEAPRLPNQENAGRLPKEQDLTPQRSTATQPNSSIAYLRVYDLKAALPDLAKLLVPHTTLIVDLRYVYADYDDANEFAGTMKKAGLNARPVQVVGKQVPDSAQPEAIQADVSTLPPPLLLVLVNSKTAGPLEAWLAAFQDTGSILAVGTATAGQPGNYAPVPGFPDYRVLKGELQPDGVSIAGSGLQPRFPVDVTPEQNYRAYFAFEKSPPSDINSLLRQNRISAPSNPAGNSATGNTTTMTPSDDAIDATLQRAVDVVAALQILERVPSSTMPATKENSPAGTSSQNPPANTKN